MACLGAHVRREPPCAAGVTLMRVNSVMELPEGMREHAQRQLGKQQCSTPPGLAKVVKALTTEATPKRTKFGNVRVFLDGEWYDSKLEYDFHQVLKLRQRRGEIAYIKRQVRFLLEGGVKYWADYEAVLTPQYAAQVGYCSEVWDAKGKDTQASKNKRKQVLARYGVEVRLWTKKDR
jgi:hypothetical protein